MNFHVSPQSRALCECIGYQTGSMQAIQKINEGAASVYRIDKLGGFVVAAPGITISAAGQVWESFEKGGANLFLVCVHGRLH
jgi:hypothetical protein